jgi:hypothetical protein
VTLPYLRVYRFPDPTWTLERNDPAALDAA